MKQTDTVVRKQLEALSANKYRVYLLDGERTETRNVSKELLLSAKYIAFLKARNANGQQISVSVMDDDCRLILLDDATNVCLSRIKNDGIPACCIVETSESNYQVWLKLDGQADSFVRTAIVRYLVSKYGTDAGASSANHPGRLAGFTNGKYILNNGYSPYIKLIKHCNSSTCSLGWLKQLASEWEYSMSVFFESKVTRNGPIDYFWEDERFEGDLHRADLSYAISAIRNGIDENTIKQSIMSRDLSKKGGIKRQMSYVYRTIEKANKYAATSYR